MLGNIPQLTGNADKDVVALYDYVLALRRELYDLLNNLDDDNIRKITAKSIATDTLKVGVNIELDPSAVIAYEQIEGMPPIYSADDIRSTIITKNWIGTLGLLVGNEIQMGSNAVISWGQVNGRPNTTYIDEYGMYTGEIASNVSRVSRSLSLGEGYKSYSALSFDGIGGIDAYDDVLHIGAVAGIAFGQFSSFVSGADFSGDVDFSNATVKGLKVRLG